MHNPSNTPSMQRADAHAMPEHAMPDAQAMPNDARGRDRELPTNSPSTPTSATSTREDVDGGRMAIDLEHLRTALNRLSDTLDPEEGPVILAWSVDRLAEALATELAELSRPVGPGVARVPVDEPDPGWVEELRGAVVEEARRAGHPVTSTPEAATETPLVSLDTIWACIDARHDVGQRHDDDGHLATATCHDCRTYYDRRWSPPAPSGLQRATEQPAPLDICAQCGFWRMAHDRNTHIFAGAAVDPTTPED